MEAKYSTDYGILFRPEDNNPRSLLCLGVQGAGKTTFVERYVETQYLEGCKIVDVWDSKNNLESCFRVFKPSGKQLRIMEIVNEQVGEKVLKPTSYPCRVWVPLSKNIPHVLPDVFELFTIPLQSLTKNDLDFLAEAKKFFMSSVVLADILKKIPDNFTLADFFKKLSGISERETVESFFGQRIPIAKTIQRFAMRLFLPFHREYIISSEVNSLALTEGKLIAELNDQKTFTVFSTKYIDDKKTKAFITLFLLQKIAQLKTEGKVKGRIIIVIRDLWTLCPRYFAQEYEESMAQKIFEVLATFRSKGIECVCDCQDVSTLNLRLSGQFTEVLTGSIFTPSEISYFMESGAFLDKDILNLIFNLRYKKIKMLYDISSGEFIQIIYPQHKHMEPEDNFFDLWKKNYNTYKDFTKIIEESKKELQQKIKKISEENKIKAIKEAEAKLEIQKKREEIEIPEELLKIKKLKRKDVEDVMKVSNMTANRYLDRWIKEGKVERKGNPSSPSCYYIIVGLPPQPQHRRERI